MNHAEGIYAEGFVPVITICLKLDGQAIIRRAVVTPDFLELFRRPDFRDAIRQALLDVEELSKPPDDRQLNPNVEVRYG